MNNKLSLSALDGLKDKLNEAYSNIEEIKHILYEECYHPEERLYVKSDTRCDYPDFITYEFVYTKCGICGKITNLDKTRVEKS